MEKQNEQGKFVR